MYVLVSGPGFVKYKNSLSGYLTKHFVKNEESELMSTIYVFILDVC